MSHPALPADLPADLPAPVAALRAGGVSIWLDDLSRPLVHSGRLADLVRTRGVTGVTSNPSIFAAAVAGSDAYDAQLRSLAAEGADLDEAVLRLTTDDVRDACDVLAPVYRATGRVDGRVSIEVDPRLAHDADATLTAARRLWATVDRPNLFIKIPATREGLSAITAALAEGISVNVTLIFALERYEAVLEAHLAGLEQARANGVDLGGLASVASFFVSRVDAAVDTLLERDGSEPALALRGRTAVANARLAYATWQHAIASDRWAALAGSGALPQRPLWASTGVKNPAYEDTRYVDELVAPHTVNTMPGATLEAVADHGRSDSTATATLVDDATAVLDDLAATGISLVQVTEQLEGEGVQKFVDAWDEFLTTVRDGLESTR